VGVFRTSGTARLALFAIAAAVLTVSKAIAAPYPDRPIHIIHPFAAGGGSDSVLRIVVQELSQSTGKAFVIENKTGAGGRIGYDAGAKAVPDGYTLVTSETTYSMLPGLFGASLSWNPDTALMPITTFARVPMVIVVNPRLQVKTLQEFITRARTEPGKLNYGSSGLGSINHIVAELFKREAQVDLTHVPFKGGAEMVTGLLNGTVDLIVQSPVAVTPYIKDGTMVALAVASTKRIAALSDVPTVIEGGLPTFVVGNWFGLMAPKGTPQERIEWLYREVSKVVKAPEREHRFAAIGAEPYSIPPSELGALIQNETRRWTEVTESAHIRAQ
jgi:tripartite-type tricarboxylate transporter receptor subunit TctC